MITDGDAGGVDTPGTANVTLLPSTHSSSFNLEFEHDGSNTTGHLYVLSSFDRETLSTFNLTVEAFDTGYFDFRKTSQTTITITIEDANDNFPEFTNATYYTKVAENSSSGHSFFQVHANDLDTILDSSLRFYLLNFLTTFSIETTTGWLSVVGDLDRKIFPNYTLEVRVNDSANHSDTAEVIVSVIEVNEHVPQFDPLPPSSITIDENENYFVLNISVVDSDLGPAGDVTISLDNTTYFSIEDNERLVLNQPLDYEVRADLKNKI